MRLFLLVIQWNCVSTPLVAVIDAGVAVADHVVSFA